MDKSTSLFYDSFLFKNNNNNNNKIINNTNRIKNSNTLNPTNIQLYKNEFIYLFKKLFSIEYHQSLCKTENAQNAQNNINDNMFYYRYDCNIDENIFRIPHHLQELYQQFMTESYLFIKMVNECNQIQNELQDISSNNPLRRDDSVLYTINEENEDIKYNVGLLSNTNITKKTKEKSNLYKLIKFKKKNKNKNNKGIFPSIRYYKGKKSKNS